MPWRQGSFFKVARAPADGSSVRAPYPSVALFFHAVSLLCLANIAFYRGDLYRISSSAWALSTAAGALGLLAPLALSSGLRVRLLAGTWPLVIVLPLVALPLSPGVIPSPITVGPFFFCAGASLTTCVLVAYNVSRRKRGLRRLVADGATLGDAQARSQLEAYFAAEKPLAEESLSRAKTLHRALRAQAWVPSKTRRARAAALLREAADFLARDLEAGPGIPAPSNSLRARVDSSHRFSGEMREALLTVAAQLENGGRLFRWRSWLVSISYPGVDNERDLFYAVGVIAKRYGAAYPEWFRRTRRILSRAALTPTDVAPPWKGVARMAKPVTVLFAVIVVANALLSTATARAPSTPEPAPPLPHDWGPLPIIAGPSDESRIEPRFSRVASTLSGRRAEVRCWSREDWQKRASEWARWPDVSPLGPWRGYTSKDHERINLPPAVCDSLTRLVYEHVAARKDSWPDALAWSVALLAHEAQHVRGISNEAMAECYGMQSISTATRELGRTDEEGRYLASLYWENSYPDQKDPVYYSRECRNGGRLDLHPESDGWP
jgi:hypothetical protein